MKNKLDLIPGQVWETNGGFLVVIDFIDSHSEMLHPVNVQMLIDGVPNGDDIYLTKNGRADISDPRTRLFGLKKLIFTDTNYIPGDADYIEDDGSRWSYNNNS